MFRMPCCLKLVLTAVHTLGPGARYSCVDVTVTGTPCGKTGTSIMRRGDPPTYFLDSTFPEKSRKLKDDFLRLARDCFHTEMANVRGYVERSRKSPVQEGFDWAKFPEEFYFVEIVTIAVLNDALWDDFCRADHTIVFIPDCLSLLGDKCKRRGEEYLEHCDQCVPNCTVNKIVSLKEKYDFREVFTYREMKDQFDLLKKKYKSVSFFGIACILMLAEGMRMSMQNGVPSHGVPLSYCGCEHWVGKPVPTDTDVAGVESVLRLKAAYRESLGLSR